MGAEGSFLGSSIGRKVIMAVTGVILVGFVLGHLAGNLQVFLPDGPHAMKQYALFLRSLLHGAGLWIARGTLLVAVALHIWSATSLTLDSRAARSVGYREWQAREATYASRTMRWSGVIVLFFVVYHLLHFTVGSVHPDFVELDPYHNLVTGFQSVPASLFYIVAMILLGLHLRHGVWSMAQTLGLSHPRYKKLAQGAAAAFAAVVVIGNCAFPIAVLTGLIK